jgi:atypical dual specificity phosphatase
MDLDQILPQLWAGECPKTADDVDTLGREYGVTTVLCLQTEDELAYWKIDWERLETHYRESGIEVQRVPVRVGGPDCLRRSLPECVRVLDRLLRSGHKVYIHCSLGKSRAPTAIVAYLHWVQDWDLVEALDYVTACRPCAPDVEAIRSATEDRQREPSRTANAVPV